jgi:hypothetical protein
MAARSGEVRRGANGREGGQGLVEFSLALIPFLFIVMGVVDLGRGIYTNNGVAEAAREIARVASVHQCNGPCSITTNWSAEIVDVVNTQKRLVPGLLTSDISITCVEINDAAYAVGTGTNCPDGKFIRVQASTSFRLITPLLPVPNPFTVSSITHIQVP